MILWSPKEFQWSAWYRGDSDDTSARILFSWHYSFCWGETPLLFLLDKSILEVVVLLDSWSSSISAGCWDDPSASVGSPRVIRIVWWFGGYFFQALLESCTSAYWYLKDNTLYSILSTGNRKPNSYLAFFGCCSLYASWVKPFSLSSLLVWNSLGAFIE